MCDLPVCCAAGMRSSSDRRFTAAWSVLFDDRGRRVVAMVMLRGDLQRVPGRGVDDGLPFLQQRIELWPEEDQEQDVLELLDRVAPIVLRDEITGAEAEDHLQHVAVAGAELEAGPIQQF